MSLQFHRRRFNREHAIAFALLFNAFSWYFIGNSIVNEIAAKDLTLGIAYSSSIIISGLFGAAFLAKFDKKRILSIWTVGGIVVPLCLMIPQDSLPLTKPIMAIFLGSSIGIGMPSLLTYFTESMSVENRGKIGGLVFFATALSAAFFTIVVPKLDIELVVATLAIWRLWSLPLVVHAPRPVGDFRVDKQENASFGRVFHSRTMILYFAAWFMFTLVDGFGSTIVGSHIEQFSSMIQLLEPAVASLSALIGGIVSDWVGRKRVIMSGFIALGVAYAALGLAPQTGFSWLFFSVVDGIATGSLWVMFTIVLWGEIDMRGTEKYYAVGETPYFLTGIVSIGLAPYTAMIPETGVFSLAAFFLFMAVVPLMYAAETLPEKRMKERELKIYIEKAQKVKQKYA
jgi:MFS family permease